MKLTRRSVLVLLTAGMALSTVGLWDRRRAGAADDDASGARPVPTEFRFVQFSDTHFGAGGASERTAAVVEAINALDVEIAFAVVTGDVMSDTIQNPKVLAEAKDILGRLRCKTYFVPGNHDIQIAKPAAQAQQALWEEHFGPLNQRFEHKGVICLTLLDLPLATGKELPGYDPMTWLTEQLRQAGRSPVLLFHHTPRVEDFYGGRFHRGWPAKQAAAYNQVINTANVRAILAGHFHRPEQHWVGDVPLHVAPAVIGYWGRQPTYRIYHYRDGKVSYHTGYVTVKTPAAATN